MIMKFISVFCMALAVFALSLSIFKWISANNAEIELCNFLNENEIDPNFFRCDLTAPEIKFNGCLIKGNVSHTMLDAKMLDAKTNIEGYTLVKGPAVFTNVTFSGKYAFQGPGLEINQCCLADAEYVFLESDDDSNEKGKKNGTGKK